MLMKPGTQGRDREFYSKLFSVVLPIAFQEFMYAAVGASDAIMLGMIDQDALSAVSLAGQVFFIFILFMASLNIGTSMLCAQYWGKGDSSAVEKVMAFVTRTMVLVSLVFFLGTVLIPEKLMRIFTPEAGLIEKGAGYLRIVGVSYIMAGISSIHLCVMKNTDRALMSTLISSVVVVLNIVLNAILIFGLFGAPEMGIAGAATATVIARIVELAWCILASLRRDRVRLRLKHLVKFEKTLERDFWRYTLPVMGNQMVWGLGFAMYSVIMGHLGTDAVAANSIANIVRQLAACFCMGLAIGGGILVGHELGRGELVKAKDYGGKLVKMSIISGVISGVIVLALAPLIMRFSSLSETANHYLKWMLVIGSFGMVGRSLNTTTIAGIFCAGGDSKFGFICDTITMWVYAVPLGLLATFVWKLPVLAVFFILNLDEIVKIPAVVRHYRKYKWVKNLTRETH